MSLLTESAKQGVPLISVCVCTYRRPVLLEGLLRKLDEQTTKDLFQFSVLVLDNDVNESARVVVDALNEQLHFSLRYGMEPRQNIAIARNASVAMATGQFIAFTDDDEEPASDWLCTLYQTLVRYNADGVLGPVPPKFEEGAPVWAVKGQVFQRPNFATGTKIPWNITGTGNALLRREVLEELEGPFNADLGAGGEDTDLFRRSMERGRTFVWSAEAICYERIPSERTRISFQLRRALLRGKIAVRGHRASWLGILKSLIALPLYVITLPVSLVLGSHVFVNLLIKSFDHLGKLLASCGIDLVGDKYITS